MLSTDGSGDTEGDTRAPRKHSLLRKFEIPIQHLDFGYVRKCSDVREIERILKVLRSGEEGHYPDLMDCVEQRLRKLDPLNRVLRVELPVIKSKQMDPTDRELINRDISEWLDEVTQLSNNGNEDTTSTSKNIFMGNKSDKKVDYAFSEVPIRGQILKSSTSSSSSTQPKPKRITSLEYDKWDKFDVEEELTRMEVVDKQISEWEKVHKPQIAQNDVIQVEKLMKNLDTTANSVGKSPETKVDAIMDVSKPSFIEDIMDTVTTVKSEEEKVASVKPPQVANRPMRRVRIQIEDVHMSF